MRRILLIRPPARLPHPSIWEFTSEHIHHALSDLGSSTCPKLIDTGGTHTELSGCMGICQAATVCTQTTPTPIFPLRPTEVLLHKPWRDESLSILQAEAHTHPPPYYHGAVLRLVTSSVTQDEDCHMAIPHLHGINPV